MGGKAKSDNRYQLYEDGEWNVLFTRDDIIANDVLAVDLPEEFFVQQSEDDVSIDDEDIALF
jgi:hypothetical protein